MNRWQQTAVVLASGLAILALVVGIDTAWTRSDAVGWFNYSPDSGVVTDSQDPSTVAMRTALLRIAGAGAWGVVAYLVYGDERRRPWHREP